MQERCHWAAGGGPLYIAYHDTEWGVPQHDDRILFEFLVLEGAQAGLSWATILNKRENYRKAFCGFDPRKVARFGKARIEKLLQDPGIVRNRLKVESTVSNARAFLEVQREFGSFDAYIWQFVGGMPVQNGWKMHKSVPASTQVSDAMSKDLKQRGFRFVGSTILYAFMQATGMVNDHTSSCFRWKQLQTRGSRPEARGPRETQIMKSEKNFTISRNRRHTSIADALDAVSKIREDVPSAFVFEHGSLQVKMYRPAKQDFQKPHTRDEIYVIARGGGNFVNGDERHTFQTGDVLFVPAGVTHRFEAFSDDFCVWVMFYGPEGGEQP